MYALLYEASMVHVLKASLIKYHPYMILTMVGLRVRHKWVSNVLPTFISINEGGMIYSSATVEQVYLTN